MEGATSKAGDVPGIDDPVALITVSYHSHDVLAAMLTSLAVANSPLAAGVIADNAPDPSIERLALSASFDYLPLENRGYGSAVNSAMATLPESIQWVLISNPDVTFEPQAIQRLVEAGKADPAIAAVGPRIVDTNGSTYPSARAIPSLRTGIGHAVFGRWWPDNPWTRRYLQSGRYDLETNRDTGWLSGACLLVRRSAFEQVGGFDENFFMYFEDVDLGFRLGRAGYRNVYAPTAVIHHIGGTSTASASAHMLRVHHQSARLFVSRKYPGVVLAPLRGVIAVGLKVREVLSRPRG